MLAINSIVLFDKEGGKGWTVGCHWKPLTPTLHMRKWSGITSIIHSYTLEYRFVFKEITPISDSSNVLASFV